MFEQALDAASTAAEKKVAVLEASLPRYLILAVLAGAYVGLGIANMTLLALALFQPHGETLAWMGYVGNLARHLERVTLGNIVDGAIFVGGAYWLASPLARPGRALDVKQQLASPARSAA